LERERALGHGKKPVSEIIVLDDVGIILTLCDGYLDTWHAMTLEPATVVPQNKGISLVARCQSGNEMTFQICVQQRKKIFLFEFVGRFELLSELSIPEPATSMMWINKSIYLACRNEYFTLDILDNSIAPLVSYESQPLMRLLSSGELLLKQERKGMLTDGMSTKSATVSVQVSSINWTTSPNDLVVHFPYVMSLQSEQIEVHSTFSWKMYQRIPLFTSVSSQSTTSGSSQSNPNQVTNLTGLRGFVTRNTALVGFEEMFVLAYSEKAVYAFFAPSYPVQAEALVNSGNIEEGLFLLEQTCDELREYPKLVIQLQTTAAWTRFKSGDWKRAIVHFSNAKCSPSDIVPSFPSLLLIDSQKTKDEDKIITNVIKKNNPRITSEAELTKLLREACIYVSEFLEILRSKQRYDDATQLQLLAAIFISKARYGTPGLSAVSASPSKAVWTFLNSLSESEQSLCLAFFEHWCTVNRFFTALGLIFRFKRLNRKALEEWNKIGSGLLVSNDPSETGIEESISLLQSIDDVELIEEFAPRVFENSKNDGSKLLAIFASKNRSTLLPLPWIQQFFKRFDKSFLEQYLEYLVFDLSTKDEKVETALAWHYLSLIPPSQVAGFDFSKPMNAGDSVPIPSSSENFHGSSSIASSSASSSSQRASTSTDPTLKVSRSDVGAERKKLLNLLEQKSNYNAAALLARIEPLPLHHEKVALYEKIGDHQKALTVIVSQLEDFDRAETYCMKHEKDGSDSLISALLRVYLSLPNPERPEGGGGGDDDDQDGKNDKSTKNIPRRAMDLIERYPTKLRPATVIATLPPETPIAAVEIFLVQSIRAHLATLRQNQVVAGIERSHNLTVTAERTNLSQRSFLITHETICPVCNKGVPPSAFARFPNGVIVHVHCMKNKHIDPLTGRNFFKHPYDQ
jgi:hypothetical protein